MRSSNLARAAYDMRAADTFFAYCEVQKPSDSPLLRLRMVLSAEIPNCLLVANKCAGARACTRPSRESQTFFFYPPCTPNKNNQASECDGAELLGRLCRSPCVLPHVGGARMPRVRRRLRARLGARARQVDCCVTVGCKSRYASTRPSLVQSPLIFSPRGIELSGNRGRRCVKLGRLAHTRTEWVGK